MLGIALVPMLATMEKMLPSQLLLEGRDVEDRQRVESRSVNDTDAALFALGDHLAHHPNEIAGDGYVGTRHLLMQSLLATLAGLVTLQALHNRLRRI